MTDESVRAAVHSTDARESASSLARRGLVGAVIGQVIEFYDFALYGVAAAVLSVTFFPSGDPVTGLLATFAVFGAAFAMRPLGGVAFGLLGDRIGRRPVLVRTLLLIGGSTALIGLLPTYAMIGWLAPVLLVSLRLVQGFSAGGESVGAVTFSFEHAPSTRRGMWVSICVAGSVLPGVVASALFLWIESAVGNDAFLAWGWRIPFLLALPLSAFGLWLRLRTSEPELFVAARRAALARHADRHRAGRYLREKWLRIVQAIAVIGLSSLSFYLFATYFVSFLQTAAHMDRGSALAINAAAMFLVTLAMPFAGRLSDRFGRRPVLIVGSALIAVVAVPAFALLASGSPWAALGGQAAFGLALALYGGASFVFYVEAFDTPNRLTAAGVSYNISYAVFGGTAPFVALALVTWTGNTLAPGWYVSAVAVLVLAVIVVTRVPETAPRISASPE